MNPIDEDLRRQINQLVDAYRDRCLWFLRADYYPTGLPDVLRTLDYIRRYGDREAFRKVGSDTNGYHGIPASHLPSYS